MVQPTDPKCCWRKEIGVICGAAQANIFLKKIQALGNKTHMNKQLNLHDDKKRRTNKQIATESTELKNRRTKNRKNIYLDFDTAQKAKLESGLVGEFRELQKQVAFGTQDSRKSSSSRLDSKTACIDSCLVKMFVKNMESFLSIHSYKKAQSNQNDQYSIHANQATHPQKLRIAQTHFLADFETETKDQTS